MGGAMDTPVGAGTTRADVGVDDGDGPDGTLEADEDSPPKDFPAGAVAGASVTSDEGPTAAPDATAPTVRGNPLAWDDTRKDWMVAAAWDPGGMPSAGRSERKAMAGVAAVGTAGVLEESGVVRAGNGDGPRDCVAELAVSGSAPDEASGADEDEGGGARDEEAFGAGTEDVGEVDDGGVAPLEAVEAVDGGWPLNTVLPPERGNVAPVGESNVCAKDCRSAEWYGWRAPPAG